MARLDEYKKLSESTDIDRKLKVFNIIDYIDTVVLHALSPNRFVLSIDEIKVINSNIRRKLLAVSYLIRSSREKKRLCASLLHYLAIPFQGMETITQGLASNPFLRREICESIIRKLIEKPLDLQMHYSELLGRNVAISCPEDSKPFLNAIEARKEDLVNREDRSDLLGIKYLMPINEGERVCNIEIFEESYSNTVANGVIHLPIPKKGNVRRLLRHARQIALNGAFAIRSSIRSGINELTRAKKIVLLDISANNYYESKDFSEIAKNRGSEMAVSLSSMNEDNSGFNTEKSLWVEVWSADDKEMGNDSIDLSQNKSTNYQPIIFSQRRNYVLGGGESLIRKTVAPIKAMKCKS